MTANPPRRLARRSRFDFLVPGLAVAAVFLVYRQAHRLAGIDDTPLPLADVPWIELPGGLGTGVEVLLARVSWGVAWMLFLVAFAVAAAGAWYVLGRGGSGLGPAVRTGGRVLALALALAGGGLTWSLQDPLTVPPVRPLLTHAFSALEMASGDLWLRASTGLAVVAAILLTAASCATLAPPDPVEPDPVEHLRLQMGRLRVVLYLGAGVLVAGTVLTGAFHHLPVPLLEGDARAAAERLVSGMSVATGTLWTLVLLSLYLPAALLLAGRARELASTEADEPPAREAWLEARGFTPSWGGQLARLAAVLAPFLTSGPAAALFELLSVAG